MNVGIEFVGLLAATCTTSAFLPQVYRTWRTKDVEGLSLTMYIVFFVGVLLWLIYGILISSLPMILANSVTTIMGGLLVYFKIKYRKK